MTEQLQVEPSSQECYKVHEIQIQLCGIFEQPDRYTIIHRTACCVISMDETTCSPHLCTSRCIRPAGTTTNHVLRQHACGHKLSAQVMINLGTICRQRFNPLWCISFISECLSYSCCCSYLTSLATTITTTELQLLDSRRYVVGLLIKS